MPKVRILPSKKRPVRSVVVLVPGEKGTMTRQTVYKRKKKHKVSKRFRKFDKILRRLNEAQNTASADYLRRHARSNRKKKNGAIRDLGKNLIRSQKMGRKKLKIKLLEF